MRKIIGAAVGAVALSVGGLAPAAFAEDTAGEAFILAASPWKTLDTGPGLVWTPGLEHPSELSAFDGPTAVDLTWSGEIEGASLGTSAETTDLGAAVVAGDVIRVDFELIDGASPAAGSVRLFAGVGAAPLLVAAAPADATGSGSLSLTVPADGTVGHMGLVYDTSNGGVEGTVRFTDLTVGSEPVLFVPPAAPTIAQPTCDKPEGVVTVPAGTGYDYAIGGTAAPAGDHQVAIGAHEVTASLDAVVQTWTLTADEPTGCSGDDDGTDDGGEAGTDDGGESGTDDGGESGTDDGGESGTDDGGESGTDDGTESGGDDGSPSPTPSAGDCDAYVGSAAWCDPAHGDYDCSQIDDAHKPVQLVDASNDPFLLDSDDDGAGCEATGDDDGSGDDDGTGDDDGSLPDTGTGGSLLWAGTALLVLGGLAALFARYRRSLTS
ncbi:hypothetical protein [Jiangella ureilytica]|uniref:hypothetical protein n=1 Tax=Jiangella ureilytica TaxID=2530374 RepID=UPI0013A5CB9D|nr:hypothetical protein [Jiangella ureilytica]